MVLSRLRLRRPVVRVRRTWRRSLLTRVVTATVLLGMVVVLALGQFLYGRIAGGLVESRRVAAGREASRLSEEAQAQLDNADPTDAASAQEAIQSVISYLQAPDRAVLIRSAPGPLRVGGSSVGSDPTLAFTAGSINEADVPPDLRHDVDTVVDGKTYVQQTKLIQLASGPDGRPHAAILVGQRVNVRVVGPYELYIAFRLDREEQLLQVVRRTFIGGGFALVFLVAAVAFVVTRWVVSPVRQAARTAEELASGRLDRRMRVRGEDDLARLARAFNEMAASLERQIHRLEELSRVQRRFVSDVSHELRTPLTTIRMAGEVMYESRSGFEPAVARSAELLQNQLDRFESLLADLLEISRFDAGAAVLEADPADVRDVVVRVIDGLRPLADRRGSLVRLLLPDGPCMVEIDARRVERVVRNLLGNAIEHGEGRPIDVRVVYSADAVAIGVRDRGVGLHPGELPQVFNRFWRGDPARARTTGGTGLGLAISLEDAHLHGGWLQVWGEPGQGAHFVLTLPRRSDIVLYASPLPLDPRPDTGPDTAPISRIGPAGGRSPATAPNAAAHADDCADADADDDAGTAALARGAGVTGA